MSNFREIVTKAVIGKAKKKSTSNFVLTPEEIPNTVLGCWVINHRFLGEKQDNKVKVNGSFDVNVWYSCENDSKTEVYRDKTTYSEEVNIPTTSNDDDISNEDVVIRSLKQPSCTRCEIIDGNIEYTVEKEMGVEIVGDVKVKIAYETEEDPWDNLEGEISKDKQETIEKEIDNEVNEEYLN